MNQKAKILGNLSRGLVFVISAPAGTGKTTLVRRLCKEFSCIVQNVSFTTRKARKGEVSGHDYHFIAQNEFLERLEAGEFLEHARVFENFYATSRKEVEKNLSSGKHVVIVIDTQGALQLMGSYQAAFIFISPPNLSELKRRLIERNLDSPDAMAKRLSWAEKEMSVSSRYDYHIINDDLEVAYESLKAIFIAEECRIKNFS